MITTEPLKITCRRAYDTVFTVMRSKMAIRSSTQTKTSLNRIRMRTISDNQLI